MAGSSPKRTRSERVAALELPPGQWDRIWASLRRREVIEWLGLAAAAAVVIGVITQAWNPPFGYRTGYKPDRDIVARVDFERPDPIGTALNRQRAREQARRVYVRDPQPLVELRTRLHRQVSDLAAAETLAELGKGVWKDFQPPPGKDDPPLSQQQQEEQFGQFRDEFTPEGKLDEFELALIAVFKPFEENGVLVELPETHGRGNREDILVHLVGEPDPRDVVRVDEVVIGDGDGEALRKALAGQFPSPGVAERLFAWLWPKLQTTSTLSLDREATAQEQKLAVGAVNEKLAEYKKGQALVEIDETQDADRTLSEVDINLLRCEYEAGIQQRGGLYGLAGVRRATAVIGTIFVLFVLCGVYMRRRRSGPLTNLRRLCTLLVLAVGTVATCHWASAEPWRAEIIPLMLFGMTMAIVYGQHLALLSCGVLALIVVSAVGHGMDQFLLLLAATTAANLNVGSIRSRSKLIYVGLLAGGIAALVTLSLGMIDDQPLGTLVFEAARIGGWAIAAGFLMTGLLPFVERVSGVLTDLSLLELGDVAHPLLQELVRRAPSTYNHSVTVGSISEAAAESIGARGLLCRVGAYFHDIGKMLKPGYFVENQAPGVNRHETLVPTMSSLVIVAHIKDGADLARQHHLPQPIIDLIEQHHGTTRVGFFYERAAEQQKANPEAAKVDESTFRYPGPMPQTKEAAVLMLADNVESASRTLVDPTPARIESLIGEIAERRLHGGQFDESGLTLRELRTIEKAMVMSLISIYHGRIKYPDQRTA
ncbi:MAG: HDIG domain-containing protein [Candidatus Nealsonbacteria bacterium]|nr:HDIG domain-containing protein [Candidatus Nealsonbacteria bacterium]